MTAVDPEPAVAEKDWDPAEWGRDQDSDSDLDAHYCIWSSQRYLSMIMVKRGLADPLADRTLGNESEAPGRSRIW